jgi:hypothetical protein
MADIAKCVLFNAWLKEVERWMILSGLHFDRAAWMSLINYVERV